MLCCGRQPLVTGHTAPYSGGMCTFFMPLCLLQALEAMIFIFVFRFLTKTRKKNKEVLGADEDSDDEKEPLNEKSGNIPSY